MHLDAVLITNQAKVAEAIHEEADAEPSGADHFCQRFLGDSRNEGFRLPGLAKLRHQWIAGAVPPDAILIFAQDKKLMQDQPSSRLGWIVIANTTVAMFAAGVAMFVV